MQSSLLIVVALNIATMGFFWWYLPIFISKFVESLVDLESRAKVDVERVPKLELNWGHHTLRSQELTEVSVIFAHMAKLDQEHQRAPYMRYFRALALMAKNDIFYQFEPNILVEFMLVLREAMAAYGDWDGKDETFGKAIETAFQSRAKTEFISIVNDLVQVATLTSQWQNRTRPIALDAVVTMKIACDLYLRMKAHLDMQEQIRALKSQESPPAGGTTAP
jgi:hypothetical protein